MNSQSKLTVRELASYLQLSNVRIYQLCSAGKLPFKRIGRAIRFNLAEVEAWIESGKTISEKPSFIKRNFKKIFGRKKK